MRRVLFFIVVGALLLDIPLFIFIHVSPSMLPKYSLVAMVMCAIGCGVAREAISARMMILGAGLVLYAAVNVLAVGWSSSAEGASRELLTRVTGLGVLYVAALVTSFARRKVSVQALIVPIAVVGAAFLLVDAISGYPWSSAPGRAAGSYVNPNVAAASVMFLGLAGIGGVRAAIRPWFLLLVVAATVLTLSRGGYVAVIASVLLLTVGGVVRVRSLARATAIATVAVAIVLSIGLRTVLADRPEVELLRAVGPVAVLRLGAGDAASASERQQVANAATELFLDHPFHGAGLTATTAWTLPVSTHNEVLRIAAELGMVGVVTFFVLLTIVFGVGQAHRRPAGPALVCWLVILLAVSHNVLEGWSHLASLGVLAGGSQMDVELATHSEERSS